MVDDALVRDTFRLGGGARWGLALEAWRTTVSRSVSHRFGAEAPSPAAVAAFVRGLQLEDLALAAACVAGREAAWEHLVLTHRPTMYRAAAMLLPPDGAREIADSLWAELYGLDASKPERRSLLTYFHGRCPIGAWLRAVVSQRVVDRARAVKRTVALDESEGETAPPGDRAAEPDPERARYASLLVRVLALVVGALDQRERVRLALYYGQGLTLAQIGRTFGEHEATVSRKLDRLRRGIRSEVERRLAGDEGLTPAQVARCFECASEDVGADLTSVLRVPAEAGKG
jgi:RNA polymerase sigma factor (sigma-70 family)